MLAEVIAGLVYNSMALLTDAAHNISDVGSLILSMVAFRLARKKPTDRFTYGYKKLPSLRHLPMPAFSWWPQEFLDTEPLTDLVNLQK